MRGADRLPGTPAIIASKHQSAWETLTLHMLVPDLAVGLKDELTRIPLLGWYLVKGGSHPHRPGRGGAGVALAGRGGRRAAGRGFRS